MSDFDALWRRAREHGATDLYTLQDGRVRAQISVWSNGRFYGGSSAVAPSPAEALEAAIAAIDAPDPAPSFYGSLYRPGEPKPAFPYGFTEEADRADR